MGAAGGVTLIASIPALRLRTEEAELQERFGPRFAGYAASPPRFIPWVL